MKYLSFFSPLVVFFLKVKKAPWAPGTIFSASCFLCVFLLMNLPETRWRELPNSIEDVEGWFKADRDEKALKKNRKPQSEGELLELSKVPQNGHYQDWSSSDGVKRYAFTISTAEVEILPFALLIITSFLGIIEGDCLDLNAWRNIVLASFMSFHTKWYFWADLFTWELSLLFLLANARSDGISIFSWLIPIKAFKVPTACHRTV